MQLYPAWLCAATTLLQFARHLSCACTVGTLMLRSAATILIPRSLQTLPRSVRRQHRATRRTQLLEQRKILLRQRMSTTSELPCSSHILPAQRVRSSYMVEFRVSILGITIVVWVSIPHIAI